MYTLRVKNFVKIALSRTVSKINAFFAFYAEIQYGRQKWRGKRFMGKVTSRLCRHPTGQKFHRNRSISLHFEDKCTFVFFAEIQDGRQNWRINKFWEKSPVDSADILCVNNFVKIALSRTVSEINKFLHFMQKFKMAAKSGGENDFWEKSPVESPNTLWVKNFVEIALSRSVS